MKKKKKYTFRKFTNDVHLWLGLGSGIILFLVCLSGTILTFEEEIKSAFIEEFEVEAASDLIPVEALATILESEGEVTRVEISSAELPYEFKVKTSAEDRRGTTFYVNQYTGEYQQTPESSLDGFFMSMFKLHRWLLLDSSIGRPIVGVASIIFLFISISGIILWFPKKWKWKNFKSGFKIKFSAKWKRVNHDLHNTLGFYACIFLVVMTLTGLCWSFEWYREGASQVLGTNVFNRGGGPTFESEADFLESEKMTIAQVHEVVSTELNYKGSTSISFPTSESDVFKIRKTSEERFSPVVADELVLDLDGQVLHKEIFSEKPLNVQVASLIKPIHTGTIYGTFSKIVYFIACLIATSLPITGTLIWWNKRKKKEKK
ncbi:MAG TPA: PepSY-associated TM helix domain-containing protein [Salinimicrobium sp.]|nr:PepSY-associated TM helix domain-containing protein [Salinimicrobium sp.]